MITQSKLDHGFYKIFWIEGGHSLAAVGYTHDGTNWYAPCNWTANDNEKPQIASTDWNKVERIELMVKNKYPGNIPIHSPSGVDVLVEGLEAVKKKWDIYVSNIEWHINANKPEGEVLGRLVDRLSDFREVVKDLTHVLSLSPSKSPQTPIDREPESKKKDCPYYNESYANKCDKDDCSCDIYGINREPEGEKDEFIVSEIFKQWLVDDWQDEKGQAERFAIYLDKHYRTFQK